MTISGPHRSSSAWPKEQQQQKRQLLFFFSLCFFCLSPWLHRYHTSWPNISHLESFKIGRNAFFKLQKMRQTTDFTSLKLWKVWSGLDGPEKNQVLGLAVSLEGKRRRWKCCCHSADLFLGKNLPLVSECETRKKMCLGIVRYVSIRTTKRTHGCVKQRCLTLLQGLLLPWIESSRVCLTMFVIPHA